MPTYQYRCTSCDRELEVVQKFTDDALTDCPECDGNLRKVFNAVGVVFKGSGFYATDNRSKGKAGAAKSGDKPEKSSEKAEKSESKPTTESKPKSESKPSSTGASSAA
jgi:putative FmdB family regulatory protein